MGVWEGWEEGKREGWWWWWFGHVIGNMVLQAARRITSSSGNCPTHVTAPPKQTFLKRALKQGKAAWSYQQRASRKHVARATKQEPGAPTEHERTREINENLKIEARKHPKQHPRTDHDNNPQDENQNVRSLELHRSEMLRDEKHFRKNENCERNADIKLKRALSEHEIQKTQTDYDAHLTPALAPR